MPILPHISTQKAIIFTVSIVPQISIQYMDVWQVVICKGVY